MQEAWPKKRPWQGRHKRPRPAGSIKACLQGRVSIRLGLAARCYRNQDVQPSNFGILENHAEELAVDRFW